MNQETMNCDVVIVGAGPAGLAAAIKIKQMANEKKYDISVMVLEKGAEVGSHIVSGAVIDPVGLDALLPDWREQNSPLVTKVKEDFFFVMTKKKRWRIPNFILPPMMKNHGNYIGSLSELCRWMAKKAEQIGVEIYPGFTAVKFIKNQHGSVIGVTTGDMGLDKNGNKKNNFELGLNLHCKYVLLAEGAHGSLTKQAIKDFNLLGQNQVQKFGIGIKEIWQVQSDKHQAGTVQHSFGWPLNASTGGGGFIYHFGDNLLSIGFVVHLNYRNPYISPFHEFQRYKTHPQVKSLLKDAKRLGYAARAITEGGYQSIPKLIFPGGALIGCSAGLVNVPRIKGSHNAILSGIIAAKAAFEAIHSQCANEQLEVYQQNFWKSPIAKELAKVRNVKPLWSKFGTWLGIAIAGIDMWMRQLNIGLPFTLKHTKPDHKCLGKAKDFEPIDYPKPDGKVSFDKMSSVFLANISHEQDQPVHLKLIDDSIPLKQNLQQYDEPAQRYCPAGVYEIVQDQNKKPVFQINAQNCVHCKTCDIKDPEQNIDWTPPEGGSGPLYNNM